MDLELEEGLNHCVILSVLTDVAEWTTIAVITVASVSLGLAVIENAITGDTSVLVASSQILNLRLGLLLGVG